MERGDIFEFTNNGVLVRAVCISNYRMDFYENNGYTCYLCYAQNRLFHYIHNYSEDFNCDTETWETQESWEVGNTLVDYCVIPEFDEILKSYE